jgi:WD40 repeat protein
MVGMFNKSNIFAIVRPDSKQKIKDFENIDWDEVIIWDDYSQNIIYKYRMKKKILNLKITFNKIVVVCCELIYVFNSKNFQLIDIIKTGFNPKGLIGINYAQEMKENEEKTIIVFPSLEEGHGQLTIKNYEKRNNLFLNPHKHELNLFSLSSDGKYLITVAKDSEKMRIFNPKTGEQLDELTIEKNSIKFIVIYSKGNIFATSSEKGVIDLWSLKKSNKIENEKEEVKKDEEDKKDSLVTNVHIKKLFSKKIDIAFNRIKQIKDTYENYQFIDQNKLAIITCSWNYYVGSFDVNTKNQKGDCDIKAFHL